MNPLIPKVWEFFPGANVHWKTGTQYYVEDQHSGRILGFGESSGDAWIDAANRVQVSAKAAEISKLLEPK